MPPITRSKRKRQQAELEEEFRSAIKRRDFARVREFVELERIPVNCADERGRTPLFYTLDDDNDLEMARFLLDNGANANARDGSGYTIMIFSIVRGLVAFAELLLEYGANIESRFRGYTPLGCAVAIGDRNIASLLLPSGAGSEDVLVNETETAGALQLACRLQNSEMVELLLDHGVNVSALGLKKVGQRRITVKLTPLCEACIKGNVEIANLLLENRATVLLFPEDSPNCPSPLAHAVARGHLPMVRLLLETTISSHDCRSESTNMARVADYLGGSLLLVALRTRQLEAAKLLVEFGANINTKDLLLVLCAKDGNLEGARFLLGAGACVNQAGKDGKTPLWTAAYEGHAALVEQLLDAGVDVSRRDKDGRETALGVAHRRGHTDVVNLLLRTTPHVWPRLKKFVAGQES